MIAHFKSVDHSYLSNFHIVDVEYCGVIYPSSEHAYMSAKSDDVVEVDGRKFNWKDFCKRPDIRPGKIKGESRFVTLIDGWDEMKVQVMYHVLVSKFRNPALRSRLLSTGNQNIQEGNWHGDTFWGVDLKVNPNYGENNLGRLLMRVRDEIRRGDH